MTADPPQRTWRLDRIKESNSAKELAPGQMKKNRQLNLTRKITSIVLKMSPARSKDEVAMLKTLQVRILTAVQNDVNATVKIGTRGVKALPTVRIGPRVSRRKRSLQ